MVCAEASGEDGFGFLQNLPKDQEGGAWPSKRSDLEVQSNGFFVADREYLVGHFVEAKFVHMHRQAHFPNNLRLAGIHEEQPALVISPAGDQPFAVAVKFHVLNEALAFVASAEHGQRLARIDVKDLDPRLGA